MATVIRLARRGRTHEAKYKITVADSRYKPTGRFLEHVGHYNPNINPPELVVNEASALDWMLKGAQVSDSVRSLFHTKGIMEKFSQIKAGKATLEDDPKSKEWKVRKAKPNKKAQARTAAEAEAKAAAEAEAKAKAEAEAAAAAAPEEAAEAPKEG